LITRQEAGHCDTSSLGTFQGNHAKEKLICNLHFFFLVFFSSFFLNILYFHGTEKREREWKLANPCHSRLIESPVCLLFLSFHLMHCYYSIHCDWLLAYIHMAHTHT